MLAAKSKRIEVVLCCIPIPNTSLTASKFVQRVDGDAVFLQALTGDHQIETSGCHGDHVSLVFINEVGWYWFWSQGC
jgi:hypothetical protein